MVRTKVVLLLFVVVAAVGVGGWADEETGLSGAVGAELAFLPAFAGDLWVDLDWNLGGWSLGALTEIGFLPAFTARCTGTVEATLSVFDLRGTAIIDVVPFDFAGLNLFAGVGLLDMSGEGFAVAVDAGAVFEILPALDAGLSLDIDASYGIFTAWGAFDLGIPGFGTTVWAGAEIRALDLELEDGQLTVDLGASTFILPAGDTRLWLDVALRLGIITVTAETDFELNPFGLAQQRIEIEVGFDGLTLYAWGGFTGVGDLTAGVGGTYEFP